MKHFTLALLVLWGLLAIPAQEFGEGEPVETDMPIEEVVEGVDVEQMSQTLAEEIAPAQTAEEAINNYIVEKGITSCFDEGEECIVVTPSLQFNIKNPAVSDDFLNIRSEMMSRLLLEAKSLIIESIMSDMSGSRILEIPGNPIAKQIEKEYAETNKQLKASLAELEKLGAELDIADKDRKSLTASELVAVISSWFTSAEEENLAAKYDADKKERYANAKEDFEAAMKTYEELQEKAEEIKGTLQSQMTTTLSRAAQMPIFGCTVLQQAESITEKNGRYTYEIAIVYQWSMKMQKAAGRILEGETVKFAPGKKTIQEWLKSKKDKGALATWIGPRNYIDNEGNMWFLGIACGPLGETASERNANRRITGLEAAAEVMFALYSDAYSIQTLNKLMQTKRLDLNGEDQTKVYKDYTAEQGESFKNVKIAGNMQLWTGTVHHEPSDLDIQVTVYGVNVGAAKTLKSIYTATHALGIEVNTYQQMETGRQQQMRRAFDASKDNPAARAAGARQANTELSEEAAKNAAERKKSNNFKPSQNQGKQTNTKGKLRTGTMMIDDDDD